MTHDMTNHELLRPEEVLGPVIEADGAPASGT